jgi:colanic acid biosynthesis glycosyl transferase WcaI
MPRIIFVNRFYWPDEPATSQLLTDLATHLARNHGRDITVIASRPANAVTPVRETRNAVSIIRVGSTRQGNSHPIGRLIDFISFIFGALWKLLATAQKGDLVIFLTDPPLLGAVAWPLLRFRGIQFAHWVQDIYPEIAVELTGQRWLKCLIPLRNLAWRQAQMCITLGRGMAGVIAEGGVSSQKIAVIPNWAPAGIAFPESGAVDALRRSWDLQGKFVLLYSGNLGRVHDLNPIIEVATELQHEPDIVFVFVGGGAQSENLRTQVETRSLSNVRFFPAQPRSNLTTTLALGDLHFVTLRSECYNYVFPSKFYGIIAAGRPLIYIGPKESELAHIVDEFHLGRSFVAAQTADISQAIRGFQQEPASLRPYAEAAGHFASEHTIRHSLNQWETLLAEN